MKLGVPWSVKGVRAEARETAREAARRSGMSLGEWLNSVILQQAEEDGLRLGRDHDDHDDDQSYAEDLAGVHQRLDEITRRLERFSRPGPEAYAPKHSRNDEPDRIAELIGRLDRRLEQLVNAARPPVMPAAYAPVPPAAHAYAPPPPPQPQPQPQLQPQPNSQLPPALDRAIAEITARQRALNGAAPPLAPQPQPQPQPRHSTMAPPHPFAGPAAPAYAPPAPPPHAFAGPAAPAYAPLPAQDLSGLEDQLRRITDQIETLRRPGVEDAIAALRAELKEIGRALGDALPRRALESIERQIQDLSQRVTENRQNGADSRALAGIEQGLVDVRDALRGLTPAENLVGFHEAVDALAHKIDLIVAQRDPTTLHQLEYAITTLREMATHVASDEALRHLAAQVEMLTGRVEEMSAAAPAGNAFSHLEQRIEALSRTLTERAQNGTAIPPRLEALVQSLADKIEQIQQSRGDTIAASHLEDRIVKLVERLDASESRLNHLEAIERGLGDLLVSIQDMRAAKTAEAQHVPDQPNVDALKHDIARTQSALEAVNGTLGHVVDRLESIEKDIRTEGRRRTAFEHDPPLELTQPVARPVGDAPPVAPPMPPAPPAPARAATAPAVTPPPAPPPQPPAPTAAPRRPAPANHTPIDPDLPPDQPLEPGSGPPRQRAGARIAASEAALGNARPAPPAGGKSSFIAAARRAAQTAVKEVGSRPSNAAEAAPAEGAGRSLLSSKMMSRVKAIFIAASIAAVAVGSVQILSTVFSRDSQAPASKSVKTSDRHHAQSSGPTHLAKAKPAAPQPPVAPLSSTPPAGNIAPALPSYGIGQSGYNMPSSLLSPPALNPPPAAATNDITGSIPQSADSDRTTHASAPPAATNADRLPIAIGGAKLRKAAAAGDAAAAYEIAARYAEGRGVPANLTEAARWYERAAVKGLTPAQFRYASLLEKGQGVKKDLAAARRLYLAAAAKGNAKAMHNLAVLYAEGADGKPDYATAAQWFEKAAKHGVADSQYNLGVLAARGLGLERNLIESYKWFALAAAQGDKEAGRKRDEVAASLDAKSLAIAQHAVKTFVALPQPREATSVKVPPGGWDDPADTSNAQSKARSSRPSVIGAYQVGKR